MRLCLRVVALPFLLPLLACGAASSPPAAAKAKAAAPVEKAAPATPQPAAPVKAVGAAGSVPGALPQAPAQPYTYEAAGRRDPFLNLLNTGVVVDPRTTTKRGEGAAGLAVNEIVVRAIVQINGRNVAMIQGPNGRNYNIHQGDKLADGTVTSVTREGLVIVQEVNDPLSTAKQREVRKLLRSLEEAKQ